MIAYMNGHKNDKEGEDSYHYPSFSILSVYFMINMEDSDVILVLQEILCKHRQQLLHVHSPFLGV